MGSRQLRRVEGLFSQYMPSWSPPARSYTTGVFSNESSALVHMVDTPELFGGELRILAAVDFVDGKIVRWVDYWDASSFDPALYAQLRTGADSFPRDLKDCLVPTQAAPELMAAATALHGAFTTADAAVAADVMHTDVVFEDRSLRIQVLGRIETADYLNRVLADVPYGRSSRLRHVVGGSRGGGFEWTAGPDAGELVGITAVEIDARRVRHEDHVGLRLAATGRQHEGRSGRCVHRRVATGDLSSVHGHAWSAGCDRARSAPSRAQSLTQ